MTKEEKKEPVKAEPVKADLAKAKPKAKSVKEPKYVVAAKSDLPDPPKDLPKGKQKVETWCEVDPVPRLNILIVLAAGGWVRNKEVTHEEYRKAWLDALATPIVFKN